VLDHVDVTYGRDEPNASETAVHALFHAGGVPVHVSALSNVVGPELYEWTLWGDWRSYQLRDWTTLFTTHNGWEPVPLDAESGSEATRLTLFAAAIRGERPDNLADFASALRVQRAVEACHAS
jgi:predicted dehydrogenase